MSWAPLPLVPASPVLVSVGTIAAVQDVPEPLPLPLPAGDAARTPDGPGGHSALLLLVRVGVAAATLLVVVLVAAAMVVVVTSVLAAVVAAALLLLLQVVQALLKAPMELAGRW